jgi:deoxyinosine 3'endonuclease (endonuclease V)
MGTLIKNKHNELYFNSNSEINGYYLRVTDDGVTIFSTYDMGFSIKSLSCDERGKRKIRQFNEGIDYDYDQLSDFEIINFKNKFIKQYFYLKNLDYGWSTLDQMAVLYSKQQGLTQNEAYKLSWIINREYMNDEGKYKNDTDFIPYYELQNLLKSKISINNNFKKLEFVAGADVAYNDESKKMIAALVVVDINTLNVIDTAYHDMEVTFPYVPGLFSFREVPPLKEAFSKLKIKPDLIVCDGHGIAHPNGIGMASHLGLELNIPTIGCAKSRLVGAYDKLLLGPKRGDFQNMIWNDRVVGVALRTQDNVNPVFVSIGHMIDLDTAINLILRLSPSYRLPETTRYADQLVNAKMKDRLEIDLHNDNIE